ncbi:glycosyltransferase family 4 protein [Bacteroides sp.]|uniref:glycosyltransferase family 4 protein n=1 Tax=Bacteroides sp. TaxID=29523 RepID=UPI0026265058|nr:glycosyltransferase family 4 protein [Bacteroides sp.]MDD3039566.1 glycosyltransferase family 4 protein [Bacteroides sp.]
MTKKIVINSQGPFSPNGNGVTTGFSKAIFPICGELAKNNSVKHVCHDYQGLDFPFSNYTICRGNKDFDRTAYELKLHVEGEKPDAVLALNEPWGIAAYRDINFGDTQLVYYIPIDGYPCDKNALALQELVDLYVPITKFGKSVLETAGIFTAEPIPHSFDPRFYYRMKQTQRNEVRAKYDLDDKFIVGYVGRLQERKNLMSLLFAFAKFAADKEDAYLFLNMELDMSFADFDPVRLARHLGIDNRIMIQSKKVNEIQMGELYNCFDLYLNTACSEGFDIPVLEAEACGVPAVVSNYSGHAELVSGHGGLIKVDAYQEMPNGINWAYVDVDDAVRLMNEIYSSVSLRRKVSDVNIKFTEAYKEENVMPKWTALFENLEDEIEAVRSKEPVRRMKI